jgi:hypothetical protein
MEFQKLLWENVMIRSTSEAQCESIGSLFVIHFCNLNNENRAPGSLSDRWSSLATIYPLRFHEIFGRWLSYNIKRQK